MAIAAGATSQAPRLRRDHGNPFQPISSPKPQTSSTVAAIPSDTPTPALILDSSKTPLKTAQATTISSLLVSSSNLQSSIPTAATSSSINSFTDKSITHITSATISSVATPALIATTSPTISAIAPVADAPSSSTEPTALIVLSVLSLAFGVLGLFILILACVRRQARRKRNRGLRREVELLEVGEAPPVVTGDEFPVRGARQSRDGNNSEKGDVSIGGTEDKELWEHEQVLPPYRR